MKTMLLITLMLFPVGLFAQDDGLPNTFVAAGVAYNKEATPNVQGWGSFAKKLTGPVYSFSTYDITNIPKTLDFSTIQYSVRTGVAVRVFEINDRISIWGVGDAGISATGEAVNGSFSGGGFGTVKIKESFGALFIIRAIHDPVAGTRYVPEVGFGFGIK